MYKYAYCISEFNNVATVEPEHGSYKLKLLPGNILLADAIGPFNIATVKRYDRDLRELVKTFSGDPWWHIAIMRSETLFMPEVADYLMEHFLWRKSSHVVSDSVILTESLSGIISKQQVLSMFERVGMKVVFANDLDEALLNIKKSS